MLVSEETEDNEKTIQTYLMQLQLEDLKFMPLSSTSSLMSRLPLLHLCTNLVSFLSPEQIINVGLPCCCYYESTCGTCDLVRCRPDLLPDFESRRQGLRPRGASYQGAVAEVGLKSGKVRAIAQLDVVPPLAVSGKLPP